LHHRTSHLRRTRPSRPVWHASTWIVAAFRIALRWPPGEMSPARLSIALIRNMRLRGQFEKNRNDNNKAVWALTLLT
jgi:hypothetical protein